LKSDSSFPLNMKRLLICNIIILFSSLAFLSCKRELSCENCKEKNKSPKAVAGADRIIVLPTDSVLLDGSSSTDPDGTVTNYKWTKLSGPSSSNILKADSAKTLVKALAMGVYQFELIVKDNDGLSGKDTLRIIVNDPAINQPPIANAGPDQTITLPNDSTLADGSQSFDPDGTITTYQWSKISGPLSSTINNPTAVQTKIKSLVQGQYLFELKVTDNGGLSTKDTVLITVLTSTNHPPIANAGPDQTITLPASTITIDGSASTDPENNITAYAWTKILGPSSFTIANGSTVQTQVTNLVPKVPTSLS
jgi:hypothetical protein